MSGILLPQISGHINSQHTLIPQTNTVIGETPRPRPRSLTNHVIFDQDQAWSRFVFVCGTSSRRYLSLNPFGNVKFGCQQKAPRHEEHQNLRELRIVEGGIASNFFSLFHHSHTQKPVSVALGNRHFPVILPSSYYSGNSQFTVKILKRSANLKV